MPCKDYELKLVIREEVLSNPKLDEGAHFRHELDMYASLRQLNADNLLVP